MNIIPLTIKNAMKRILSLKGILYLTTRYGNIHLRRLAFDSYYESGKWDYLETTHSKDVVQTVEQYLNKGTLLDIGCGPGIISKILHPDSYSYYLGIDASENAIQRAIKFTNKKVQFRVEDFHNATNFNQDFWDVILFEESLYYLPSGYTDFCQKLKKLLTYKGVFIVTIADTARYHSIITGIRTEFNVIEDRLLCNSQRILLVFR